MATRLAIVILDRIPRLAFTAFSNSRKNYNLASRIPIYTEARYDISEAVISYN